MPHDQHPVTIPAVRSMLEGSTLLVTGGTGSFGNSFVTHALKEHNPAKIIVFSRDEKKQHDMRINFADDRISFVLGDIRDREQIVSAMRDVNYVFHAAALKQVPSCEFFPMEAVRTNIIGTDNVLEAAERNGVTKTVVLSTDKAVYPINAMGQTKALMEKLMLARAKEPQAKSICCGVRYGNVMYSRGSVIPLFVQQIKSGQPLTVTCAEMTRLLLPLMQAVDLVTFAMQHAEQGDLFVRKAPAATVQNLAEAMAGLFGVSTDIKTIGIREGEKMHEVLVNSEELHRAEEFDDYYRILNHNVRDYEEYFERGVTSQRFLEEGYTSENAHQLSVPEVQQLLLTLPKFVKELETYQQEHGVVLRKKSA